jgi:hypothetical protein
MATNNLHIEPYDIVIVPFGGGYAIRVERINTEALCERCIMLEEIFQCDYHLILDVSDFDYMGYLTMTLNSLGEYTEDEITQIIANEINNLI